MQVAKKSLANMWASSSQTTLTEKLSATYFFLRYTHAPVATLICTLVRYSVGG